MEMLRHAALHWWSRALDPRGKKLPPEWHAGVATLEGTIRGSDDALRATEARYLDGHDVLFPELAAGWRDLRTAAGTLGDAVAADDIAAAAEQALTPVLYMARADGLEAGGRTGLADELADRVARQLVNGGTDG